MSFEDGQKLLYLTIKDGQPHAEVVTFKEGGTHFDQYDVISSNVYTKEQILEMFDVKSCICSSSPPGVLLDDGTCGNCGGVVKSMSDSYKASMERHYGLRICPVCGHQNRHPNNHCDECTNYLKPLFKMMNCPRCRGVTRKGNNCDRCDIGIPICYGVVAPRTQYCDNCVYTVECLEEQNRLDEPMMETWNCPDCGITEWIIYGRCHSCGHDDGGPDDRMFSPGTLLHEIKLPSDKIIELVKASDDAGSILCPNCKQPVGDKYEHSEGDYDGISVDQWWECPDVGSEEETP